MRKELSTVVCASILLGASSLAFAGAYGEPADAEEVPRSVPVAPQPDAEPPTAYWYIQAGAVVSIDNFDDEEFFDDYFDNWELSGSDIDFLSPSRDVGWGYDLRAGRRLNEMLAVELEWQHVPGGFDGSSYESDVDFEHYFRSEAQTMALTVNGKFYPITGRFQPFALVGIGWGHVNLDMHEQGHDGDDTWNEKWDWDGDGFVARFGLGLDVLITDAIGVAAEVDYLLPTGPIEDFDQIPITLSAFYNFL